MMARFDRAVDGTPPCAVCQRRTAVGESIAIVTGCNDGQEFSVCSDLRCMMTVERRFPDVESREALARRLIDAVCHEVDDEDRAAFDLGGES